MKNILFLALAGIITFSLTAQSGVERSLAPFTKVSSQEGIDVFLTKGTKESAKIDADGVDVDEVLTDISGGTLKIHLDGDNHRNVDVKVYVTYVELSGLSASSASSIKVRDKVTAKGDFDIKCSSAADIEIELSADELEVDVSSSGDVDLVVSVNRLELEVSSAGDIEIEGTAKYVDANASSSGDIDGYDLTCDEAELRASSGSSIKLTVNKKLDARASSGASIRYEGNPTQVNGDSSSGGSVRRS
ncbi:MAG: head GIN domain-containing protein [Marinoscillum sp.]